MKKTVLLLFVLISLISSVRASESDSAHAANSMYSDSSQHAKIHNRKSYLAVNATFFLRQFLNFATQSVTITSSPYIFDYRFVPRHSGFRISAGVAYNQSKTSIPASQSQSGFDEVDKDHVLNVSFRVGYVYQTKIAPHWTIIAGADLIGTVLDSAQNVNTGSDNSTNTAKGWTFGLGPSMGIQFDINKRMGLYTEAAIYYTYGSESANNTFNSFQQQNGTTTISSNGLNFIIPLSIYYYVRF